jgi:hypothetical protein
MDYSGSPATASQDHYGVQELREALHDTNRVFGRLADEQRNTGFGSHGEEPENPQQWTLCLLASLKDDAFMLLMRATQGIELYQFKHISGSADPTPDDQLRAHKLRDVTIQKCRHMCEVIRLETILIRAGNLPHKHVRHLIAGIQEFIESMHSIVLDRIFQVPRVQDDFALVRADM